MNEHTANEIAVAPAFNIINDRVTVTSLGVARHFDKQHQHVLRDVRELLEQLPSDWGMSNFGHTHHINPQNGQQYPLYNISRDGFALLAFGFTGAAAIRFKLAYIDGFNRMEARLNNGADKANDKILQALHAAQINQARMMRGFQKIMGQVMRAGGLPRPQAQPDPERAFSEQERATALFLFREGVNAQGISKRLNRTHQAVAAWMASEPECVASFVQRALV